MTLRHIRDLKQTDAAAERRPSTSKFLFRRTQGKCLFLPGSGGSRKFGGTSYFLSVQKGIKRFSQIEKGGSLIYFKRNKISC